MSKQKVSRRPRQIFVDNILTCYFQATETDRAEGLTWYIRAHVWAKDKAMRYNIPLKSVAGIMAALSPQCPWYKNLIDANEIMRSNTPDKVTTTTYNVNRQKAIDIKNGGEPLSVLGGNKTTDFYRCIERPENKGVAVVDRHAAAIAYGRALLKEERSKVSGPLYYVIANSYRVAARVLGLLPSQLQAITWVTWRRNLEKQIPDAPF